MNTAIDKTKREGTVLFSEYEPGAAIKKAVGMERGDILFEMKESKLKGRGGAGFPTSTKWMLTSAATGDEKYVICNADEGEPGTFKDRVLLLEYPELVFDGMVIAGYTVGAKNGIVYLRGEYTYMLKRLEDFLEQMRKDNLLGEKILGTDFSFDIQIRLGSGAYVCGEETALIESLEGHRGEPRNRPPYPVNTGFMGHPTTVNNVETLAAAAHIVLKGGEWYAKAGTDKSSGSKLFSVSGDCKFPGVYELPWGTTVAELLETVGAEDTKAVQIGGASGHCVPCWEFNRTISFEDVSTGGSIIVFGADRDMLEVAENFLEFFEEESCGQCTPCRIGNTKLLEGVHMLKEGKCSMKYLRELLALGETMQLASKCGLGQSAPNAFVSIVAHFKDEIMGRITAQV